MANFHVDSSGNLWLGDTSTTFTTSAPFYVQSDGTVKATSGTIGGISINSSDIQANYSSGTSGFKIDTNGDAEFNSVDIRIGQANSDTPSTGFTTLDIGSTQIYENNDDLFINTSGTSNFVNIRDRLKLTSTSSSGSNMQLMFDGVSSNDAMGFRHQINGNINDEDADLIWTNQSGSGDYNKIAYVTTTDDYFHLGSDAPGIKTDYTGSPTFYFDGPGSPGTDSATFNMAVRPYTIKDKDGDIGSSGQVLSSTGSRIDWIDLPSGNDHPDSDHSFAAVSHSHSTGDISGGVDNYDHWTLNVNGATDISSGETVSFTAGSNMGISRSGNSVQYTASIPSLSLSNTNSDNASYPFVTAVSGHTITRTRTASASIYTQTIFPRQNNTYNLGGFGQVWATIYRSSESSGSDQRKKENIETLDYGLDFINQLQPKKFNWKSESQGFVCNICGEIYESDADCTTILRYEYPEEPDYKNNTLEELSELSTPVYCTGTVEEVFSNVDLQHYKQFGFMAQDILPLMPDDDTKYQVVNYDEDTDNYFYSADNLVAVLTKAVQELSTQVSDLTARIETLEG